MPPASEPPSRWMMPLTAEPPVRLAATAAALASVVGCVRPPRLPVTGLAGRAVPWPERFFRVLLAWSTTGALAVAKLAAACPSLPDFCSLLSADLLGPLRSIAGAVVLAPLGGAAFPPVLGIVSKYSLAPALPGGSRTTADADAQGPHTSAETAITVAIRALLRRIRRSYAPDGGEDVAVSATEDR